MNANGKETKSASKAQKKTQKANKKQQQKQQQQQQQQQQQINNTRNLNGKNSQTTSATSFGNNNGVAVVGSNRANGKATKTLQNNQQISYNYSNNNNNKNNNNNVKSKDTNYNNNTIENNYNTQPMNISQKLKDYYESEKNKSQTTTATATTTMPGYENIPKMERSNSFSLRGKLSKLINSITGSKENLPKATDEENGKAPFSFTRSRSMILLRRPNRRSLIEPQLEQLSEEAEKSNDTMSPTSPRKNSLAEQTESETAESPVQMRRRAGTLSNVGTATASMTRDFVTPARRQSAQPFTSSTPVEENETLQRKPSLVSLTPSETSYNPQLNFQKRRSNTLIASFKSTFAGLATNSEQKKKEKMNPKWSASLQSLQAIDNMVSYENMSFIDYDKFNGYEKQLERQLSIMSINEKQQQMRQPSSPSPMYANNELSRDSERSMEFTPPNVATSSSQATTPQTVVRRRKHSSSSLAATPSATVGASSSATGTARHKSSSRTSLRSVNSFNFDTDYEHNLDKLRNVYRDSLDSRKLELLNELSRNSFILDKHVVDVLNLEDGSVGRRCAACAHRQTSCSSSGGGGGRDVVDATSHTGAAQVSTCFV